MKTTTLRGFAFPVILTAGMTNGATGRQIFGVFADADDARSIDADSLAIATVSSADLTPEQIEIAEANSESLAD